MVLIFKISVVGLGYAFKENEDAGLDADPLFSCACAVLAENKPNKATTTNVISFVFIIIWVKVNVKLIDIPKLQQPTFLGIQTEAASVPT